MIIQSQNVYVTKQAKVKVDNLNIFQELKRLGKILEKKQIVKLKANINEKTKNLK